MLCQTYVAAVCGNGGTGPLYPAEWWVEVQVNEIDFGTFHLKFLAIVKSRKQTKRDSVNIK